MAANVSLPVMSGRSAGADLAGEEESLMWLWQTVGATCCWAMSDVICDLCIKPGDAPAKLKSDDEVIMDMHIEEISESPSKRKLSSPRGLEPLELPPSFDLDGNLDVKEQHLKSCNGLKGAATSSQNGVKQAASSETELRQRKKSSAKPEIDADSPAVGTPPLGAAMPSTPPSPVIGRRGSRGLVAPYSPSARPLNAPTPVANTVLQTAAEASNGQLTPEQNALLSGCISLCAAAVVSLNQHGFGNTNSSGGSGSVFRIDAAGTLAALGGCFHFSAYLATLRAFSSASSTVITPLMQLSAMWMLPFSTIAALFGFATLIRPVHLLSVALICTGGFLPAAQGSLSSVASSSFWKQSAVRYVVLGELLICFYNVILHQATFGLFVHGAEMQADSSRDNTQFGTTIRFFLISRIMNGLSCLGLFLMVPSLRCHALALRKVSWRFLSSAIFGESLSTFGVCLVTFSYSSFYEPSVVNAVEGGLQQLFNLLFALAMHHIFGFGPGVDQVGIKIVSFLMVAFGLVLSTVK